MFKRYVNIHANGLNLLARMFINKFDRQIFCFFANIFFYIRGIKTRFFYLGGGNYRAEEEGFFRIFKNKTQALNVYNKGLGSRNESLYKVYFLHLIDFENGDVVIDCGANVGDLYFCFKEILKIEIKYIGFEPSPREYEALVGNVGESSSENLGLWNCDSNLNFYVSSEGADSSIIEPINYTEIVKVDTKRLDSVISENTSIKLLKLEAEGAEPEVLEGSINILRRIEYISADLGFERGIDAESTLVPVVNFLLANGFELLDVSHGRICALFKNKSFGAA